ncbi:hypothetical protein chiPu_0019461 [Chiloscyllium punctatum]|uniref:Uncharacterized protein n=1 Tax=Chiloscyllium punctatum TaxID=137246 RepID=A0A401RRX4_CHIPU|nr:hypothetical protein [Chiloscyllium punctatum]
MAGWGPAYELMILLNGQGLTPPPLAWTLRPIGYTVRRSRVSPHSIGRCHALVPPSTPRLRDAIVCQARPSGGSPALPRADPPPHWLPVKHLPRPRMAGAKPNGLRSRHERRDPHPPRSDWPFPPSIVTLSQSQWVAVAGGAWRWRGGVAMAPFPLPF